MTQVMKGIRVLEVAQFTFVPAAGAILADWGADVIKVEHPVRGDTQRGMLDIGEIAHDHDRYTRLCEQFHLAVAEASHNRVLVVQLMSLQHISWPKRNRTLTRSVARHIQDAHEELLTLIEARDVSAARRLMDDHVKMIRARRVAERRDAKPVPRIVKG